MRSMHASAEPRARRAAESRPLRHGRRAGLVLAAVLALVAPLAVPAGGSPASAATSAVADYPTWADVQAARASEAATATQVAAIKALLVQLQTDLEAKQADEVAKGELYAEAQDAYDLQVIVATDLQTQADTANAEAVAAKTSAARLIAALNRQGGEDVVTELLSQSEGASADSLLYRLGTLDRLSVQSDQIYAEALRLQNTAQSLSDQAKVAQAERDRLKVLAEQALAAAQDAAAAAAAALAEQQDHQVELETQLAVLTEKREATEVDYQAGVVERERQRQAALAAAAAAARNAGIVNGLGWARPSGGYISSPYGNRYHPIYKRWQLHNGTDIAGQGCGAPIFAVHSGVVTYAGSNGTLGNYVQIDHGDGTSSGYGHIIGGGILVSRGQSVGAGQQIARVGSTGASTGCHLHFIIRVGGNLADPVPFMSARGISLG